MSFKEFDMSEYYNVLEEFKKENRDKVIKHFGSIDKFDKMLKRGKAAEAKLAKMAIEEYGSIKKYAEAVKKNLNNSVALTKAEQIDKFKKDCFYERNPELKELYKKLTADLSKNPVSDEIQKIAGEITSVAKRDYDVFKNELGDYYWLTIVRFYSVFPKELEKVDKENGGVGMAWIDERYGDGAAKFIGKALKTYLGDYEPKIETLYKKLTADLSKDPLSKKIQKIVSEIVDETEKQHESLEIAVGENYWSYKANQYLSESILIKVMDKKYGDGAAKFIGEALKFYVKNNK